MILGYARASISGQSLDEQHDALTKAGAGRIFADIITGTARHRPEFERGRVGGRPPAAGERFSSEPQLRLTTSAVP